MASLPPPGQSTLSRAEIFLPVPPPAAGATFRTVTKVLEKFALTLYFYSLINGHSRPADGCAVPHGEEALLKPILFLMALALALPAAVHAQQPASAAHAIVKNGPPGLKSAAVLVLDQSRPRG